jgi:hypothetical protein
MNWLKLYQVSVNHEKMKDMTSSNYTYFFSKCVCVCVSPTYYLISCHLSFEVSHIFASEMIRHWRLQICSILYTLKSHIWATNIPIYYLCIPTLNHIPVFSLREVRALHVFNILVCESSIKVTRYMNIVQFHQEFPLLPSSKVLKTIKMVLLYSVGYRLVCRYQHFSLEDEGSMFLQNNDTFLHVHTELQPNRSISTANSTSTL